MREIVNLSKSLVSLQTAALLYGGKNQGKIYPKYNIIVQQFLIGVTNTDVCLLLTTRHHDREKTAQICSN